MPSSFPQSSIVRRLEAPASGGTIALDDPPPDFLYLTIDPAGALATLTVELPAGRDGAQVVITTRQTVTTLTISGGADWVPNQLPANGVVSLRYEEAITTWVRS